MKKLCIKPKRLWFIQSVFMCIFLSTGILNARAPDSRSIPRSFFNLSESAVCRKELIESWFVQSPEIVKAKETQVLQNEIGDYFLVRHEEENGELQIIVAPLVKQKVFIKKNELTQDSQEEETASKLPLMDAFVGMNDENVSETWIETWPKNSPGAWILYRDALTGKNLRIRCYFVPDKEVYVEFFPGKEKCSADFIIFGASASAHVPLPVSFERLYTLTFEELYRLTRHTLPWNYTGIFTHSYDDVKQMIGLIRFLLPSVRKAGWFREKNTSLDFLRWIIDGLVKPATGAVTVKESLTRSTVDDEPHNPNPKLRGTVRRAPDEHYASLNYIRNLAAAAISARTGIAYNYNNSGADVKTEAFSYYTDSFGVSQGAGFSANSGYPIEMLKPLFYVLGVTEAHRFFLGAVRQNKAGVSGSASERHVFTESAAFFPWFDKEGHFQVSVFEKAKEYTLDEFIDRYRGSFVFLVRVKVSAEFYPDRPDMPPPAAGGTDTAIE